MCLSADICRGTVICSGLVRVVRMHSCGGHSNAADAALLCACAAELLTKPTTEKLPSDAEGLQASFAKLESVIAQTAAYVDDVVVRCGHFAGWAPKAAPLSVHSDPVTQP